MQQVIIDTTFDFRTDSGGKDPDIASPTLRKYHQLLWSKPLPGGLVFELDDSDPKAYLRHCSAAGEFVLSSDTVIPTFAGKADKAKLLDKLPSPENEAFATARYTIGGMMVWPAHRRQGKMTINQARGLHQLIGDRMDLTLECVRRHYLSQHSPLCVVLQRYSDYFSLFQDFLGYVEFFDLQDLVTGDGSAVRFAMPFDDFESVARPKDFESYTMYKLHAMEFIQARNRRMKVLSISSTRTDLTP